MLNIKLEDVSFLEELSKKMVQQDKRATSYPLFMVYDKEKNYSIDGSEQERVREDEHLLCAGCLELVDEVKELPEYCLSCDSECFASFNWEILPQPDHGIFFTAEACDAYIQSRHYEFAEPCSYAISAYWSEEMKRVMDIIVNLTGDSKILK